MLAAAESKGPPCSNSFRGVCQEKSSKGIRSDCLQVSLPCLSFVSNSFQSCSMHLLMNAVDFAGWKRTKSQGSFWKTNCAHVFCVWIWSGWDWRVEGGVVGECRNSLRAQQSEQFSVNRTSFGRKMSFRSRPLSISDLASFLFLERAATVLWPFPFGSPSIASWLDHFSLLCATGFFDMCRSNWWRIYWIEVVLLQSWRTHVFARTCTQADEMEKILKAGRLRDWPFPICIVRSCVFLFFQCRTGWSWALAGNLCCFVRCCVKSPGALINLWCAGCFNCVQWINCEKMWFFISLLT